MTSSTNNNSDGPTFPLRKFRDPVVSILAEAITKSAVLGQPIEYRWFSLVPLFFALYLVYAWIKVRLQGDTLMMGHSKINVENL